MEPTVRKHICHIDCTSNLSSDTYFDTGDVAVVRGAAGCYRQAAAKSLSRFGYRFSIENVGQPHIVIIRYPDDARRFMIINDGTTYDSSTGIYTGHVHPISNEMKEVRLVFWPRWKDCSLCFMTWGQGEPAAVASIDVHELEDLPELKLPAICNRPDRRELGIQYEDPCGIGMAEGARTFGEWLDHVVTYAKHTGQKRLTYPICWYHGPFFPSKTQPSDAFNCVAGENRTLYGTWTLEPPDWPAELMERFDQEGLEFQGVLTLLRLGNLLKDMNIDLKSIHAGADTYNNMLWNGCVQEGTMDWTTMYNSRNYSRVIDHYRDMDSPNFEWVYGEKRNSQKNGEYHPGPMFNPLHPKVQEQTIEFFREIGQRYGRYESFKGVAVNMWIPTLLWFGSIHSGYDDYTVELFAKETGIEIPKDIMNRRLPNRFSKRYDFLTFHCRDAWINWRCKKIRDFIRLLRNVLREGRSDLVLTLNLWCETTPVLIGRNQARQQIYARQGAKGLAKEAGLDLDMFADEPGIEIDLQIEGGGRDRTPSGEDGVVTVQAHRLPDSAKKKVQDYKFPPEAFHSMRDHDYLDVDTLQAVHAQKKPGAFIFNAWHEAWGKHEWFPADDTPQAKAIAEVYGKHVGVDHTFCMNSTYPEDGFWWDSQLRITHAFPPEEHFMEPYAHSVAELDACRITRGGLFLDRANGERIAKFAAAYRALPAVKFDTVGETTDPVAIRTVVHEGQRYLYLVNREYYPIEVTVKFDTPSVKLTDLVAEKSISTKAMWPIKLGAYELRVFTLDPKVNAVDFTAIPPADIEQNLIADAENAFDMFEKVRKSGRTIIGMERLEKEMRTAIMQRRLAWLRRALTSYIVDKSKSLSN